MKEAVGKKNWIFADGDLPPAGDKEPFGHESIMVLNLNEEKADLEIDLYFDNKEPVLGLKESLDAQRVKSIYMHKAVGEQQYKVPFGQYAIVLRSNIPVVAVFGRLDVRQPNMAFYSVQGYSY